MAFTNEQLAQHVQHLKDQGLEGRALHQRMFEDAQKYGISPSQVDAALGFPAGTAQSWIDQNINQQSAGNSPANDYNSGTPANDGNIDRSGGGLGTMGMGTSNTDLPVNLGTGGSTGAPSNNGAALADEWQRLINGGVDKSAAINQIANQARNLGLTPGELGSQFGMSADQINQIADKYGEERLTGIAPPNAYEQSANWIQDVAGMYTGLLQGFQNFQPQTVTAPTVSYQTASAEGYDPSLIRDQPIDAYMNPYTSEVIDRTMADMNRVNQMTQNNIDTSASAAGAFGGSRHGVANALTNERFIDQAGNMASGLRQAGYNTALSNAAADAGNINAALGFGAAAQNAAGLANASMANQANQFNASQNLAAQQFNQNALNQYGFQSANLGLSAASGLAGLAQQNFGNAQTINNDLFTQGLTQQQLNQQALNNAMNQYNMWMGYPAFGQGLVNGSMPSSAGQTTTTTGSPGIIPTLGYVYGGSQ